MTVHAFEPATIRLGGPSPKRLAVFLHGVGATASSLAPIAQALFGDDPDTANILLLAPDRFDGGAGRQWFSVAGVTLANRAARVAAALPSLRDRITALANAEQVDPENLTIVGFSQGAIMTLALATTGFPFAQAVALSGRLAGELRPALPTSPQIVFSHGLDDPVIPAGESAAAAHLLAASGYRVRSLLVPRLGHTTNPDQLARLRGLLVDGRQATAAAS